MSDASPVAGAERILVLAPNWLGDAVMALPAIADVRRAYASARLVVAARRPVADLFALVPGVDEVVTLEWSGRWWRRRALDADIDRVRAIAAGRAILLPNSFASAWLARRAGVADRRGYASDLRGPLLTRAVPRPRGGIHQGAYYQHLTEALGMARGPLEPELSVPPEAIAAAGDRVRSSGWDGRQPLVVFAPGAAYGTAKRWLPTYVARVASDLVGRERAHCVLVGSRADGATTREVIALADSGARPHIADLAGETSIATLAGVLSLARACVSNDSGAMHVAAALGTPLVAIFGPTRERETAPLARVGRRAEVLLNPVHCRPCMLRDCPTDHRCMAGLPPDRVYATLVSLLSSTA
jgi:heptosyltransferase-2